MPNYYYRGPWDNEQDNIKKVIIEKGVTNIGDHAFYGFPFLTSVSIPNTVTTIGDHAFRNCPSLSSVSIGNSVTSIGDDAFNGCSSLTSISIPNSVVSIGNAAFISCTSLTYINIPNSVTSIGNYAFRYCSSLTTANIPNSVTAIAYCAFDGCSSLTTINLPNSVTSIGDYAFHNCISLTSISIPYHVTSIGKWAFYGCKTLSKLTCNALIPPYVGKEVFHGTKCESGVLYVPASAVDSYKTTGIWRNWKNIQSIENSYIVILDHNGGKGETEHITAFYDEPMPENIGLEIPTRTGYKFTGYSINEIFYYDENLKSVHNFDQRKDLTLYANWKARNTMVILDSQGGNGGTPQVTAIYEKTMPIGDNITPPTRAGYIFDGYYSSIDGKGTKYYNADMTSDCYWYIDTEKSTIYANWIVIPVTDITISDVILSLWADETKSLTATATPSTANNTAVEWSSSDNNVATVSAEGLITAKGQGTCTITCTAADGYGTTSICEVSVKQQVTSIALSETTTSLWVGDTKTITAKATPTTASNTAVEWSSSDENVVSVSSEGVITAKGQGTCIISCTAADGYGTKSTCEVTIKQQVTEIALNETTTSLWVGDTKTITATTSPTTASNTSVEWSSSDNNVASVSSEGVITANGEGTCTITCTAVDRYGTKSTCEVIVKQQVTEIALSETTASLWVGDTKTITATALPTTANNTSVEWSSSDENVASVSSEGVITANGEGTCIITCTAADGYGTKSTCEVTVKQQVTEIALSETNASLWVGETKTITATASPTTANNTSVEWYSSDDNVASVSSEGVITANGEGTCIITCTAADGYGTTSVCEVTVMQQTTSVEQLQVANDKSPVYYNLNGQRTNKSNAKKGVYIINGKKYAKYQR